MIFHPHPDIFLIALVNPLMSSLDPERILLAKDTDLCYYQMYHLPTLLLNLPQILKVYSI